MDVIIRSYPDTSYYVGEDRVRWVYGTLCIYSQNIVFTEKTKNQSEPKTVNIPFYDVIKVNKATATILYGAIVVTLKSGKAFWFSSFQDRESVLRFLCHFQKSALLSGDDSGRQTSISASQRTAMGTKLLSIAHDSVSTLANAAVDLSQQGEKIDHSTSMMFDIHNDLDVGDRMMTGLEAWLGRWKLPEEYKVTKPFIIKDNDIPEVYDFEVLFTKIEFGKICQQKEGVIQISKNGISILDLKQKVLYHFEWSNVSKVRVISPWEMMVIRYQIGKPDISYSFISYLLIHVLQRLQYFVKHKMDYESPNLTANDVNPFVPEHKLSFVDKKIQQLRSKDKIPSKNFTVKDDDELTITFGSGSGLDTSGGKQVQDMVHKKQEVISEQEIDELSSTLRNLKSMMLAVGEETDTQNEKLGQVTESVDDANFKIVEMNKRMNKLT